MLLQIPGEVKEIAKDAVRRTFDTNPDSVFGVLAGVLFLLLVLFIFLYVRQVGIMVKTNNTAIETLNALKRVLELNSDRQSSLSRQMDDIKVMLFQNNQNEEK